MAMSGPTPVRNHGCNCTSDVAAVASTFRGFDSCWQCTGFLPGKSPCHEVPLHPTNNIDSPMATVAVMFREIPIAEYAEDLVAPPKPHSSVQADFAM